MCSVLIGIVLMLVESLFTKLSVRFPVSHLLILKNKDFILPHSEDSRWILTVCFSQAVVESAGGREK